MERGGRGGGRDGWGGGPGGGGFGGGGFGGGGGRRGMNIVFLMHSDALSLMLSTRQASADDRSKM